MASCQHPSHLKSSPLPSVNWRVGKPRGQTKSRQSSCYTAAKDARTDSRSSFPPASISWQYPRSGEGQLSSPCPNPTSPRTTPRTTAQSRFSAFHSRSWSDFSWPAWIPSLIPNYPTNKQASAEDTAPSTRSWSWQMTSKKASKNVTRRALYWWTSPRLMTPSGTRVWPWSSSGVSLTVT